MRTFFTFSRQPLRMQWSTLGGFNLGCRRGDRDPQGRRQVSRAHHSQSGSSGAWCPQSKRGDKREAVTRNVTVFTDCSSPACLLKFSDWEQCAGESSPTPGQKERALLLDFAVKKREGNQLYPLTCTQRPHRPPHSDRADSIHPALSLCCYCC